MSSDNDFLDETKNKIIRNMKETGNKFRVATGREIENYSALDCGQYLWLERIKSLLQKNIHLILTLIDEIWKSVLLNWLLKLKNGTCNGMFRLITG